MEQIRNIKRCRTCGKEINPKYVSRQCSECYHKKGTRVTQVIRYRKKEKEKKDEKWKTIIEVDIEDIWMEFPKK